MIPQSPLRFSLIGAAFTFLIVVGAASLQAQISKDGHFPQGISLAREARLLDDGAYDDSLESERFWQVEEHDTLLVSCITDPKLIAEIRIAYAHCDTTPDFHESLLQRSEIKAALLSNSNESIFLALASIKQFHFDTTRYVYDEETIRILFDRAQRADDGSKGYLDALLCADPLRAQPLIIALLELAKLTLDEQQNWLFTLRFTPATLEVTHFLAKRMGQKPSPIADIDLRIDAFETLCELYLHSHSPEREIISQLLLEHYQAAKEPEKLRYSILSAFANNPTPELLPLLLQYQDDEKLAHHVRAAIVKVNGAAAQSLVREMLVDEYQYFDGLSQIPVAWAGDTEGALKIFLKYESDEHGDYGHRDILERCWRMGGRPMAVGYLAALENSSGKLELEEYLRLRYLPIDDQHPLSILADTFFEIGLLEQPFTNQELENIRAENLVDENTNFAEILIRQLPCFVPASEMESWNSGSCDYFLKLIVPASKGKLHGLECYDHTYDVTWNEYKNTTCLIFREKAYMFDGDNHSYSRSKDDNDIVVGMLLSEVGAIERFVPFQIDNKAACLFAEPSKAKKAIATLRLEE